MAEGTHDLDAVLDRAAAWLAEGRGVAFATVVRTWGSSPRPAGSKLACNEAGEFVGSVSGGCIEAAVIAEAVDLIGGGRAAGVLSFGVADERAWEVGLACGGRIEVFIEVASADRVRELRDARAHKRAVVLITPLASASIAPRIVASESSPGEARTPASRTDDLLGSHRETIAGAPGSEPPDSRREAMAGASTTDGPLASLRGAITRALRTDEAVVEDTPDGAVLVEPHNPPLRLVIVGAVHVAAPLAQIARVAGFAITIVDPRRAWATAARFPHDTLVTEWPDVALAALRVDARTAIVALTHDPKIDDPGLVAALRSPAFYVGCLGSKKTHAARRERLAAQGFDETALARLHGPVGLDIGAKSPAEIAVSILAEIIAALRGRDPRAILEAT